MCMNIIVYQALIAIMDIQIILKLLLVLAMYCQASSSQLNEPLTLPHCLLAKKEFFLTYMQFKALERLLGWI